MARKKRVHPCLTGSDMTAQPHPFPGTARQPAQKTRLVDPVTHLSLSSTLSLSVTASNNDTYQPLLLLHSPKDRYRPTEHIAQSIHSRTPPSFCTNPSSLPRLAPPCPSGSTRWVAYPYGTHANSRHSTALARSMTATTTPSSHQG